MLGMTIETTDGHKVGMNDSVWICEINEDCTKHVPEKKTVIEVLNDNEQYFYFDWQACQDYCNDINNIEIP